MNKTATMQAPTNDVVELTITKEINASVETVFNAWTQPETIKQWFAPDDTMTVPNTRVDLVEGGEYMIHLHDSNASKDYIVSGTYEEIKINEKLVFNWMWKDGVDRTQVTLEFQEKDANTTLLTLSHRGFSQQEFADKHNEGWQACLESLANTCQKR